MASQNVNVIIHDEGTLLTLDTEAAFCFRSLGKSTRHRATHVEPDSLLLRLAFHVLRLFFGDKGRMSEFTRHWSCLWRVNITPIGGPILAPRWKNRQEAIDAEVEWLNENFL